MEFNPQKAIETLRENAIHIERLGDELRRARIDYAQALAELLDSEQKAREEVFTGKVEIKSTQFPDWRKWQTAQQIKNHDLLQEQIRDLKEQIEIIVEVNNSLKMSYRLFAEEYKNTNLT